MFFFGQVLPEIGRGVVAESDQASSGSSEAGDQLRKAIDQLQHDLMKLEMHLVEQVDVRKRILILFWFVSFNTLLWGGGGRGWGKVVKSL